MLSELCARIDALMDRDMDGESLHLDITEHIFANSPTMLALCLTMVGLIKIYAALHRITALTDDFLMLCLSAFLLATIFSYLALRGGGPESVAHVMG
jgi:hypothetical protein